MQLLLDNLPLLLVASVFAPLTAWFAAQRSRHPGIWFIFGALLGPVAMGLIAIAPPGRCPACAATVQGWVSTCVRCSGPLGGVWTPATPEAVLASEDPHADRGTPRRHRRPSRREEQPPAVAASPRMAPDTPISAEVLSTGIYLSGNAGLEIGACYALARLPAPDGDRLRVFGPVDTGQITVRHERRLTDLEITVLNDRVIVSGRQDRSSPTLVFQSIGGLRGEDLERAFTPVPLSPP